MSFFHPVSQRQTCFVTHILADLAASRPSDPVRREKRAAPGCLFRKLWRISHFLPQTTGTLSVAYKHVCNVVECNLL